jgi:hypothetical protein
MDLSTMSTKGCGTHTEREDEVCPLCLSRYASSAEQICVACEAPSCPDCVELTPSSGQALCYACHGSTKH